MQLERWVFARSFAAQQSKRKKPVQGPRCDPRGSPRSTGVEEKNMRLSANIVLDAYAFLMLTVLLVYAISGGSGKSQIGRAHV